MQREGGVNYDKWRSNICCFISQSRYNPATIITTNF